MKINFSTKTIQPMCDWLLKVKHENIRDEKKLREILSMDDYHIEFLRYGDDNLPVCKITFEEVVDFFMNFDRKKFDNVRLDYKQESFLKFYEHIEERIKSIEMFNQFTEEDKTLVSNLLNNGLPANVLEGENEFTVLFTISIGNSMGWPYENYIDFDVANLDLMEDKESFLHVIAHEIHHTKFGDLINENMTSKEMFYVNFAFEGLAVHFNNNAATKYKPSKYPGKAFCMVEEDWKIYEEDFDQLFAMIKADAKWCETLNEEQTMELIGKHYERFDYTSLRTNQTHKVSQYPTYYFGCYFWGIIDLTFGKEVLFDTLKNPSKFEEVYNKAVEKIGDRKYRL